MGKHIDALERADQLMRALVEWYNRHGYLPTTREIADHIEWGVTSVHQTLALLHRKGLLLRRNGTGVLVFPPEHVQATYVGPPAQTSPQPSAAVVVFASEQSPHQGALADVPRISRKPYSRRGDGAQS